MLYGVRIEQLLINAFAGESQARNRYTIYASIAKSEGQNYIANIFLESAMNEYEHAKLFYKHISSGNHYVNAEYPFFIGSTLENLKSAADAERDEWENIYRNSSDIARNEGYNEVADLFMRIIEIEKHHEFRFTELYNHLKNDSLYKKDYQEQWLCNKCGYITISDSAPEICPCCFHSQDNFKLFTEKF